MTRRDNLLRPTKRITLYLSILLVCPVYLTQCHRQKDGHTKKEAFTIIGANALYPLAADLARQYEDGHPNTRISVFPASSTKGISSIRLGVSEIGMYSGLLPADSTPGILFLPVARDAVVPVVNSANPALANIREAGLDRTDLAFIFTGSERQRWDQVVETAQQDFISPYIRSDASGASEVWAEFLGVDRAALNGTGVYGDAGMTQAVRMDENAAGYDNLRFVYDKETGLKYPGLEVAPIDFNGNSKLDTEEDFYGSLKEIQGALRSGNYPFPLSRVIYFVISTESVSSPALEFLTWTFAGKAAAIEKAGYVGLSHDIYSSNIQLLQKIKPEP